MVVLDNATIWPGDGRSFLGHVVIDGDRIRTVGEGRFGPTGAESDQNMVIEDLGGRVLTPGLIDLMVLGGFDQSILRNDPLDIAREYLRLGVTSCQFCNGTLPWEAQVQVARNVDAARSAQRATQPDALAAARVIGLYLEGPFQHPDFTGASLRENAMLPTPENVDRVLDSLGSATTMINVSPGLERSCRWPIQRQRPTKFWPASMRAPACLVTCLTTTRGSLATPACSNPHSSRLPW